MPTQKAESRDLFQNVDETESTAITLKTNTQGAEAVEFDILAYMAPGMALLFLMYTVSYGGRSILQERSQGTLPRLMISPTSNTQVLGGKVLGIFLMGVAQVGILILASTIFFRVQWGDSLGVLALILASRTGSHRLGHAHHCPGTHACASGQRWLRFDVDIWNPGRKFYRS